MTINPAPGPPGPKGMNWCGSWNAIVTYAVDDAVEYQGRSYISVRAGSNQLPATSGSLPTCINAQYWQLFADKGMEGLTWKGTWDVATPYYADDVAYWDGSSYVALQDNTGHQPTGLPADIYWSFLAEKGEDGQNATGGGEGSGKTYSSPVFRK